MKIFNLMAVIAAAVMFVSCNKEPQVKSTIVKNDYFSLSTDGTLKAKIAEYNADDFKYLLVNNEGDGETDFTSQVVKIKVDGTLEMKLGTPSAKCLQALREWWIVNDTGISVSNKNINFTFCSFLGFIDEASTADMGNRVASLASKSVSVNDFTLAYVDGDVDIIGTATDEDWTYKYNLHFKKGWNIMFYTNDDINTTTIPTDFQLKPFLYEEE